MENNIEKEKENKRVTFTELRAQLIQILQVAAFIVPTQCLTVLPKIITHIFAGHISNDLLNAIGSGDAIINLTAVPLIYGLASASETIFTQVNGNINRSSLGMLVQRCLLIMCLCLLLSSSLLVQTYSFMRSTGHAELLSCETHQFVLVSIPALLGNAVLVIETIYLQSQKRVRPCLPISVLANIIHAGFSAIFLVWLKMGVIGAGVSTSLTMWTWAFLMFGYIWIYEDHKETWSGLSRESLRDWMPFLKLGIPAMLMTLIQKSVFMTFTLLAGVLGPTQLAVHLVLISIVTMFSKVFRGTAAAATVIIGNYLGSSDHFNTRIAVMAIMIFCVCLSIFICTNLIGFHFYIPHLFNSDIEIIGLTRPLVVVVAFILLSVGTSTIGKGILTANGEQCFGAICNVITLLMIGIPLGVYLMFWTSLGIAGSWVSILCAQSIQAVIYLIKLYVTNWETEVGKKVQIDNNCNQINTEIKSESSNLKNESSSLIREDHQSSMRKVVYCRLLQTGFVITLLIVSVILSVDLNTHGFL